MIRERGRLSKSFPRQGRQSGGEAEGEGAASFGRHTRIPLADQKRSEAMRSARALHSLYMRDEMVRASEQTECARRPQAGEAGVSAIAAAAAA